MDAREVVSHEDFRAVVYGAIKKYNITDDPDDVIQDVALRILKYGSCEGLKLTTIIYSHVLWSLSDKKKHKKRHKTVSLDKIDPPKHDISFKNIEDSDECDEIISNATNRQKQVLSLIFNGKTQVEIAQELGCKKQNIGCILNTLRKNLI